MRAARLIPGNMAADGIAVRVRNVSHQFGEEGQSLHVRNLVEGRWNFEQARRRNCPPWGLWGGTAGEAGGYLLRLPGENEFKPMVGAHIPVPVLAESIVRTGGGGGWGDPMQRDPEMVRADVREELVSREAARERYGVVLRDDFSIDENATRQLRSARPRASGDPGPQAGTL